jgi:hypothetical protein
VSAPVSQTLPSSQGRSELAQRRHDSPATDAGPAAITGVQLARGGDRPAGGRCGDEIVCSVGTVELHEVLVAGGSAARGAK